MKVRGLDFNDNGLSKGKSVAIMACKNEGVEGIIAPAIAGNHNETSAIDSE